MKFGSLLSNIADRLLSLPTALKVVVGVVVLAALGVGSVLMYQAYDYVQHDNEFCLECHLMQDPYEQFAESAHRGLGCKACHRPSIVQRGQMGLSQIVVNPDSIRAHAHVPNEVCAECHIEGNPEEWRLVANTAGHRIHLESDDPVLEGLNCVECHSSGVHQFTPTDQTCGQGGCHENTTIELGEMADLTIHCVTCHDFARPLEEAVPVQSVATSLRPQAEECLSCHRMRTLLPDIPVDEPHGAECGVCHNPHDQTTPAQAVQTCASSGCHASPDTLTPFHRGLATGELADCTQCHEAHGFRIHEEGQDCLECHSDVYQDQPTVISSAERPVRLASAGPVDPALVRLALAAHAEPADAPADPPAAQGAAPQDTILFWHAQHRGVECTACHSMERTHGGLTVTSLNDCRSCHHTAPEADNCLACHDRTDVRRLSVEVQRIMNIRVGSLDRPRRGLPFDHQVHAQLDCERCHTEGLALSASNVSCASCHDEHHQPTNDCMACHDRPAAGAHDLQVHLGCAGSGCHEAMPQGVQGVPRTRDFCLVCHQDLTDHQPGQNCENCHTLPRPRSAAVQPGWNLELSEP
ncbi:MAG: hypothetical protein ACOCVZ_00015 [Gemmatimonadota bacterium]